MLIINKMLIKNLTKNLQIVTEVAPKGWLDLLGARRLLNEFC